MTTVFGRISVVAECAAPGRNRSGAGRGTLCIVGKNGAVLLFCPGAIPIGSPGFFFIKNNK